MEIRRAKTNQWQETAAIARMLWPSHEKEELEQEFRVLLQNPDAAVFFGISRRCIGRFRPMWPALGLCRRIFQFAGGLSGGNFCIALLSWTGLGKGVAGRM